LPILKIFEHVQGEAFFVDKV